MNRILILLMAIATGLASSGCSNYTLRGRAVQGDMSGVWIVDDSDPRLADPGLAGVTVSIKRDPQSLGGRVISSTSSDGNGEISIGFEEFGAGWMEEQWEIRAARTGYEPAVSLLALPWKRGDKRILVVLAPGYQPDLPQEENLLEQYERFK
jgi:hypothetical protein